MVTAKELYDYALTTLKPEHIIYKDPVLDRASHETTVYRAGGRILVFIGGSHVFGNRPFARFISKVFSMIKPAFLLVEAHIDTPKSYLISNLSNIPEKSWSEREWAVHLAHKRNIGFMGFDASSRNMLLPFTKISKDGIKIGILAWLLRSYYSQKVAKVGLDNEDNYLYAKDRLIGDFIFSGRMFSSFRREFLDLCKRYDKKSIYSAVEKIVDKAASRYIEKRSLLFLICRSSDLIAPYPYSKNTN